MLNFVIYKIFPLFVELLRKKLRFFRPNLRVFKSCRNKKLFARILYHKSFIFSSGFRAILRKPFESCKKKSNILGKRSFNIVLYQQIFVGSLLAWDRIFYFLRAPGIDSKASIPFYLSPLPVAMEKVKAPGVSSKCHLLYIRVLRGHCSIYSMGAGNISNRFHTWFILNSKSRFSPLPVQKC